MEYWKRLFDDCEPVLFPQPPPSFEQPVADATIKHLLPHVDGLPHGVTLSTMVRAAWGLVASGTIDSNDVVFGAGLLGDDNPASSIDGVVEPTLTTVPIRIKFSREQKVAEYLQTVQKHATEMIPFENTGLETIAKASPRCLQACRFQTLLVTQEKDTKKAMADDLGKWPNRDQCEWFSTYSLILLVNEGLEHNTVQAGFDSRVIGSWVVQNLLQQLAHVLKQLGAAGPEALLSDVTMITPQDLEQIWQWNRTVPAHAEEPIHSILERKARLQPEAIAIHSWDGDLSYRQLDQLSTNLATHLIHRGITRGKFVLLCFEKSKWATVSMLAMSKTGGAFVKAAMVLSSRSNRSLSLQLCEKVLDVTPELFDELPDQSADNLPAVDLDSIIYVVFTSGTTGTPKGAIIHHRSSASAVIHQTKGFGYNEATRLYDFSTYSFDGSILNAFTVFSGGGCLCVPTDDGRKSFLAESMESLEANAIFLTPSVAGLLSPEEVPHLTSMIIGGEAVSVKDIQPWWDAHGKQVFTIYGPSECTPVSMINPHPSSPEEAIQLGWGAGQVTWVVSPDDHNTLVPLGSVGELLLEGPLVGAGYLGEPEKTAATFIESPSWLINGGPNGQPGRHAKLYKTGDLVKYNSDGNLTYITRKDTQVKIRGQRVELSEVESYFYKYTRAREAVAEMIQPGGSRDNATLVMFLYVDDGANTSGGISQQRIAADGLGDLHILAGYDELSRELSLHLPRYMIPAVCFCLPRRLPRTPNGKMNRKLLQEFGSSLSPQQFARLQNSEDGVKRQPQTAAELKLRELWARNLMIAPKSIGLDDSFFQLGGNSIGAMKLVNEARAAGLYFSVSSVFQAPKLEKLAAQATIKSPANGAITEAAPPQPFSLLQMSAHEVEAICKDFGERYNFNPALVEDMYPCTALQEGILSLSARGDVGGNEYVYRGVLEISTDVDVDRLRKAWHEATQMMPILRTRIVEDKDLGLVQLVLNEQLPWAEAGDLVSYIASDRSRPMGLGDALSRFAIIEDGDGRRSLVWTLHHAIYDGWSLPMIEDTVSRVYNGAELLNRPGFNTFISHLQKADPDEASRYWRSYFNEEGFIAFPEVPPSMQPGVSIVADRVVERECTLLPRLSQDITVSTLIRGALSIVLSHYTGSQDVVFGSTVWGRNVPVVGVGDINGPTFATVPIRARLSGGDTAMAFLQSMQRDAVDMMSYEHTGLSRIAALSDNARSACSFQTLLVVQPQDEPSSSPFGQWRTSSGWEAFSTYALTLNCFLQANEEAVVIKAAFDARVVDAWKVELILDQLAFTISQLLAATPDRTLGQLDSLTRQDTALIQEWNSLEPPVVERCLHDIISEQARATPQAPALCTTSEELDYEEMDDLSDRLAQHLHKIGVRPEVVVPLCFEKSIWTTVAMLGVQKAGGAFVLLDPTSPSSRLQMLCRKVSATTSVTSAQNEGKLDHCTDFSVVVSRESLYEMPQLVGPLPQRPLPTNAAYCIFTSGSTGEPKACKIDHRAFASGGMQQSPLVGISRHTRAFQYGSYSFAGCIQETFLTLLGGGCLCVPTEDERLDQLADVMGKLRVTWAFTTASVLAMLTPSMVSSLETVCIGGEPVRSDQIKQWASRVNLRQTYGSSETSTYISSELLNHRSSTGHVGKPATGRYWIVDQTDMNRLAPVGAPGDLLIEGPSIGREYVGDEEKTAAAFISAPSWRASIIDKAPFRFLRTGDLAQYRQDGSIELIGRKDMQVKLYGQRIELGEIEHQTRLASPLVKEVVVELVTGLQGDRHRAALVAFVVLEQSASSDDDESVLQLVRATLENVLPRYMVPSMLVPLSELPKTTTGKTNRKKLREMGLDSAASLAMSQPKSSGKEQTQPMSKTERRLRDMWASVLAIAPEAIGTEDNFFRLGGDSISIMRLVSRARDDGIVLSVSTAFQNPQLGALACVIDNEGIADRVEEDEDALSAASHLLGHGPRRDSIYHDICRRYNIDRAAIEDIYPCTPLQEGLVTLTSKRAGDYIYRGVLKLGGHVQIHRFKAAWEAAVREMSIMRTRIVEHSETGLLQVILKDEVEWASGKNIQAYLGQDKETPMGLGDRLCRLALIGDDAQQPEYLVWTLHHALYDGWSFSMIEDTVQRIYEEKPLIPRQSFKTFVSHVHKVVESKESASFWQTYFEGAEFSPFPRLPAGIREPSADAVIHQQYLRRRFPQSSGITTSTLIRAALALVLGRHTSSGDVIFGTTVWGRTAPVNGIEHISGPTFVTVPIRARIDDSMTVMDFLESIQRTATDVMAHEHMGLQHIAKVSDNARQASEFQTLLVVNPEGSDMESPSLFGTWETVSGVQAFSTYGITLNCSLGESSVKMEAGFDSRVIDEWNVRQLMDQLDHTMSQVVSATTSPETTLAQLEQLSGAEKSQLAQWNGHIPTSVEQYVHDLIAEQVRSQRESAAVSAWDGELTYGELDEASTSLARYMVSHGRIPPGAIVPLCFEKSIYTVVAIYAVLKAGAAFVLLDPSQPHARLKAIVDNLGGDLLIGSAASQSVSRRLSEKNVLVVSQQSLQEIRELPSPPFPFPAKKTPESILYVCFTSGSTGTPKGAMVSHAGFCSAVHHQRELLGLRKGSRMFDFVSYSFDVSIYNMLATLIAGGCVCVPSEQDRMGGDLTMAINSSRSTIITLTPSAAHLVDSNRIEHLETVVLLGEAVTGADVEKWKGRARVVNAYGPAETSVLATINPNVTDPKLAHNIGTGAGAWTWIVDPRDHNKLASIGQVGELVIDGPVVGPGYLGEEGKTRQVFFENPLWLQDIPAPTSPSPPPTSASRRMYKTGDLVKYNEDGSLTFVGRKDTQIKIRGQRVELGEVEYSLAESLPEAAEVVVEVVLPQNSVGAVSLAAFIAFKDAAETRYTIEKQPALLEKTGIELGIMTDHQSIRQALSHRLPRYMVPSSFFWIKEMPRTASGKTDRNKLRNLGLDLSRHQLTQLRASRADKRRPTTDTERQLRTLWSGILGLDEDGIGLDDSFFELGGDSIAAIRLVSQARACGITLSMAAIFDQPQLESLSRNSSAVNVSGMDLIAPFSMISPAIDLSTLLNDVARECHIGRADVEDIYPCTPLQEGLLSATSKRQDHYVFRSVLHLDAGVDLDRLKASWKKTVRSSPILRTRIVDHGRAGLVQVVVRDEIMDWGNATSLDECLAQDAAQPLDLGSKLCRLAVVDTGSARFLVWTMHHCLYDGWSFPMMEDTLRRFYEGGPIATRGEFKQFVSHLQGISSADAKSYWQSYLGGTEAVPYPALPLGILEPVADTIRQRECPIRTTSPSNITTSTLIRSALAIVLARFTASTDVVFGSTVWGRDVSIPGIEDINGPTFATVPVRIQMRDREQAIVDFLQGVQHQVVDMVDYQHMGLHNISNISESAQSACQFQTLLVVEQRERDEPPSRFGTWNTTSGIEAFSTYALTLNCHISKSGITVQAGFDGRILDPWTADRFLDQLCDVFTQLVAKSSSRQHTLAGLDALTTSDYEQLARWNAAVPRTIERCLHDLIAEHSGARPNAPAISSWDGEISYGELDALAEPLAKHLRSAGVREEVIVPLLFEKSKWTAVAVLAVLKAGGAFVLLDPAQPDARLRSIMDTCSAGIVCTSIDFEKRGLGLASQVVVVGHGAPVFDLEGLASQFHTLPQCNPSSAAYACFTSGSTGTPKGSVMTHTNFASASHHQLSVLGFNETTRSFDFASHGFDMAVHNVLATLIGGGCICVPSEKDRHDNLTGALNGSKATVAILTPSVARLVSPKQMAHLKTILLMGEPICRNDIDRWDDSEVHVMLGYGPSECSCFSNIDAAGRDPSNLGNPVGLLSWIVDPEDHNKLVPIGQTGELVLEGPLVGRGYLKDPEKTIAAWVQDPAWLTEGGPGRPGRRGRVYKSGDLVRYNEDGSLSFVERKDTQVKIRGQRVELGDVQYHVQECMPSANEVLAEIITPHGEKENAMLAVFLAVGEDASIDAADQIPEFAANGWNAHVLADARRLNGALARRLPRYMVPDVYFVLRDIPRTPNGKANRRGLRELASSLSPGHIAKMQTANRGEKREPQTAVEKLLRDVWARALSLDAGSVGLDDSFFQLGGNSITAMRLVSQAREAGLELSVAIIFERPELELMAKAAKPRFGDGDAGTIPVFSLLGEDAASVAATRNDLGTRYSIAPDTIEDIYPCTALQEGLLSITSLRAGDYVYRGILEISSEVDLRAFKNAWEKALQASPILRTRIMQHGSRLLQVVVKESVDWLHSDRLDTYLEKDKAAAMHLGQPLMRLAIVDPPLDDQKYLVWTLHHALYDGVSFPMIEDTVRRAYAGEPLRKRPDFKSFISYLQKAGADSESFWRSYLSEGEFAAFPAIPSDIEEPTSDSMVERSYKAAAGKPGSALWEHNITDSTLIRSAVGLVLSRYTNSTDVVFGTTLWGRNVPVVGVEDINGPTFATVSVLPSLMGPELTFGCSSEQVPIRVKSSAKMNAVSFLKSIQKQSIDMIPYEHYGLNNIAKVSESARTACGFQTLLVIQTAGEEMQPASSFGTWRMGNGQEAFSTYGLTLNCFDQAGGSYALKATFDSGVIEAWKVERLLERICDIMAKLADVTRGQTLADIDDITLRERDQLSEWQDSEPQTSKRFWIVDSNDHNRLCPIGAPGTLLIEGPKMGSSDAIPGANIVATPDWRTLFAGPMAQFLLTRDLAVHNRDGSITLLADREQLRDVAMGVMAEQPATDQTAHQKANQRPKTEREIALSQLWAETLGIEANTIGLHDSFFQLGGDSIMAMKLSAVAREHGWILPTRQIMRSRTIALMEPCLEAIGSADVSDLASDSRDGSAPSPSATATISRSDVMPLLNGHASLLGVSRPEDILETFPCSPMQEHMLSHQKTDPLRYWTTILFKVLPTETGAPIDGQRLRHAWRKVVRRHNTLRSALVTGPDGCHVHAVLDNPTISASLFSRSQIGPKPATIDEFQRSYNLPERQETGMQHHLSIAELDDGSAVCCLEMNHALYDGFSRHLLWDDLTLAYHGRLPMGSAPSYEAYVSYVREQPQSQARSFWGRLLSGSSQPCLIPTGSGQLESGSSMKPVQLPLLPLAPLRDFCSKQDVTVATVIRAAWAIVLRAVVGTDTPVFGNLTAGRDVPVSGITQMMGPTLSILPSVCTINSTEAVGDLLVRLQEDFVNTLTYQNLSLTEMYDLVHLGESKGGLFNSTLSYQRAHSAVLSGENKIHVEELDAFDLTEFEVGVGALEGEDNLDIKLWYLPRSISQQSASQAARMLSKAITELTIDPTMRVEAIQLQDI
ncbi:hypothetical protein Trco_007321 [Trichoderma cornu-damae]|uniref:Carrier domain-containing protein n=1 Tax=Trichoderma cornu-damae TaxID=654480 RepID=A0A9P8QE92_9HYPO|nr:hypothetical protein Trco_007321 [Trichoderma cornu-damae]